MTAPTVYFIDDSATMREVIKIAFRRENINVVACHDAASGLSQMEHNPPDVVISDVIMPEKDGYEVCQHIKQHPQFARTPVILMSGVVNRSVAEKAFAVKADELIRKPFQPQDLIARVKHLLNGKKGSAPPPPLRGDAPSPLTSIFAAPATGRVQPRPAAPVPAPAMLSPLPAPPPPVRVIVPPVVAASEPAPIAAPAPVVTPSVASPVAPIPATTPPKPVLAVPPRAAAPAGSLDLQKLRIEVLRLENLVKKLQSELQAEREYSRALEAHIKTLQEAE